MAGAFNIAFASMARLLAAPRVRVAVVGLFNAAMLGLRAGSGLTVRVLGALINVQWSLALSAMVVVVTPSVLFARATGRVASDTGFTR